MRYSPSTMTKNTWCATLIYIYVPDVHTHHLSRDTALASCSGVLGFGTFLALGSLFAFGFAFAFATPFSSAGVDPLDPETAPLESSMLVLNSLGIIAPASHLNSTCTHTTHIFIYLYTSVCVYMSPHFHVPTFYITIEAHELLGNLVVDLRCLADLQWLRHTLHWSLWCAVPAQKEAKLLPRALTHIDILYIFN